MKRLRNFISMDRGERLLLVKSLAVMIAVRLALFVAPVQRVVGLTRWANRRWPRLSAPVLPLRRAALRIAQARAYCPLSTCLSESIAAQLLLARQGYPAEVRIGVSKEGGRFAAHAWLECPDGIVIGNPAPEGKIYNPLPSLEGFFA